MTQVRAALWAVGMILLAAGMAMAETASAPHVDVTSEGIDAPQAQAIADTLSAAWSVYVDDFGFDLPDKIACDVKCAAGNPVRLWTDGSERVYLLLSSKSKLDQPGKSGVFNLYGMCHELGHVAMYRTLKQHDWISGAGAEGWAHYAGSVVVDRVYEIKGETLWPDRYDYRADGSARMEKALAGKSPSDVDRAAGQWRKLEGIVGRKGLAKVFQAWQSASTESSKPGGAMDAASLEAGLALGAPDKKDAVVAWWKDSSPLLFEATTASGFKKGTIDRNKLTGQPVKLALDDGTSDGMKSIAGGGHARKFSAPGPGKWYLVAVSVYGSRYGRPQSSSSFDLALCDANNGVISTWSKPFSLFPYGKDGKWVRIELPPALVPQEFQICLNFRPTATNGVYVNFDSSTHDNSQVAVPGKPGEAFGDGDWMIRVELDQPRDADPLKGAAGPAGKGM